ncbi:MAG: hypothetical protein WC282_00870 [Bacilli bacterium]
MLQSIVDGLYEEDSCNKYRSSGEGSIYLKLYVAMQSGEVNTELKIDNYQLVLISAFMDDDNYSRLEVKFGNVSTLKPNLNDYPLSD